MPAVCLAVRSGATVSATCNAAVSQFLQQQQPPFSPFIATTVMLMAESARGETSPFAPYFATLPEATDCLLNWSEQERQLLAGGTYSGLYTRTGVMEAMARIQTYVLLALKC
jgi:hypothetical protein